MTTLDERVAHLHSRLDQVQAETEGNSRSVLVLLVSFLALSFLLERFTRAGES